jgi:hypothetical protein
MGGGVQVSEEVRWEGALNRAFPCPAPPSAGPRSAIPIWKNRLGFGLTLVHTDVWVTLAMLRLGKDSDGMVPHPSSAAVT